MLGKKFLIISLFFVLLLPVLYFVVKTDSSRDIETTAYVYDNQAVEIDFHGEVANDALFGEGSGLTETVSPVDVSGKPEGEIFTEKPQWLKFTYRVDGIEKEVLIAKTPIANNVSWQAIARAGAAVGDEDSSVTIYDDHYNQDAAVEDIQGNRYLVRLPQCGTSALGLSEWNMLIGGVHEGDMDFNDEYVEGAYGWVRQPYTDSDLHVGYEGSLNWCRGSWDNSETMKVLRGYFFVSRLHTAARSISTDRIYWRPVLELVSQDSVDVDNLFTARRDAGERVVGERKEDFELSPDGTVKFYGSIKNADLFGESRLTDQLPITAGRLVTDGTPDWLKFKKDDRTLFVAQLPIRYALSWETIARAGAALGDGSRVTLEDGDHSQDAVVTDVDGNRYRVRLLQCGDSTLGHSEWNRLLGGVHEGDGDFNQTNGDSYSWVEEPYTDDDLLVGRTTSYPNLDVDLASWCAETQEIDGTTYAVNRGYFTVARFHATKANYQGTGFGWRPVLELIE